MQGNTARSKAASPAALSLRQQRKALGLLLGHLVGDAIVPVVPSTVFGGNLAVRPKGPANFLARGCRQLRNVILRIRSRAENGKSQNEASRHYLPCAKTITGLLVGIPISEGAIRSIDDTAATYVPELEGTAYGATPLRALLHMSSGATFRETNQPDDDVTSCLWHCWGTSC